VEAALLGTAAVVVVVLDQLEQPSITKLAVMVVLVFLLQFLVLQFREQAAAEAGVVTVKELQVTAVETLVVTEL
jgi:hypothetical protein